MFPFAMTSIKIYIYGQEFPSWYDFLLYIDLLHLECTQETLGGRSNLYSSSVEHGVFGRTSICHHVKVLCTDQTNRNSQINRQRLRKDIEHNSSQMNASFVY